MKKTSIYLILLLATFEIHAQTLIATSSSADATANHNQRKIVRDSLDNVYVVFTDSTEQGIFIKGVWLNRELNLWSDVTQIMNGANPSLAISKNGKFNLVYESNDSLKQICFASSWDFLDWTTPLEISESGKKNHLPVCDCDSAENLNVFWIKDLSSSSQSLMYACIIEDTLNIRKSITTKSVINDIAVANHLQNFKNDLLFSIHFAEDSLQFFWSENNMGTIDTFFIAKGIQPCISFNSTYDYFSSSYDDHTVKLLFIDELQQLNETECVLNHYSDDSFFSKILSPNTTDYICIDDVLPPIGFSYLFMQNETLFHGFSYGTLFDYYTIMDTITSNPFNPSIAYKKFNSLYIDYIWMEKNVNDFNIFYKRDEKLKNLGLNDFKKGREFTITGYPNPFKKELQIEINVENESAIPIVELFNIDSKRLTVLEPYNQTLNNFKYSWNARTSNNQHVPAGVYFIRCTVGGKRVARKVIYIQ
ncbi:MAG: T9SS type A sorting domain-containing protein [Prolixibacteraceae bacterium]|nr:T9SS type A sorting domain-containing protein [Prolixibacteraceae bacterium]